MARTWIYFLLAAVCVQYASAACNQNIIKAINTLNEGQDYSGLLSTMDGEYTFVYIYMGSLTSFLSSKCLAATYATTDGVHTVTYHGATTGQNILQYKDKTIQVLKKDGTLDRTSYVIGHSDGILAQYSCGSGLFDVSFTSIAVRTADLGTPKTDDLVAKYKEQLATVGIKDGIAPPPCSS